MKKLIYLMVFFGLTLSAQIPQSIGFQMVVRNNSGVLISKKNLGIRISILKGSTNGIVEYQETFLRTTNANGFLHLPVGLGKVVSGKFSAIDWSSGSHFIKSEIDPNGGAAYSIVGVSQLLSVPYAFAAAHANYNSLDHLPNLNAKVSGVAMDSLQILLHTLNNARGLSDSSVVDIDGNVYNVVKIGNQYWLKENLVVTRFNNGILIPSAGSDWLFNTVPKAVGVSSPFKNLNINGATVFSNGLLYNGNVAISNNVCPIGYHVPSDSDFVELANFLGGLNVAGGKMKINDASWTKPNNGATNSSGFSAVGAGTVDANTGVQGSNSIFTVFWTSSSAIKAYLLTASSAALQGFNTDGKNGNSIRCIRN